MPPLAVDIDPKKLVSFTYTNWRGETRERRVQPLEIYFGTHPQYPTARWIMHAWDLDKGAARSFDISKITAWRTE